MESGESTSPDLKNGITGLSGCKIFISRDICTRTLPSGGEDVEAGGHAVGQRVLALVAVQVRLGHLQSISSNLSCFTLLYHVGTEGAAGVGLRLLAPLRPPHNRLDLPLVFLVNPRAVFRPQQQRGVGEGRVLQARPDKAVLTVF